MYVCAVYNAIRLRVNVEDAFLPRKGSAGRKNGIL